MDGVDGAGQCRIAREKLNSSLSESPRTFFFNSSYRQLNNFLIFTPFLPTGSKRATRSRFLSMFRTEEMHLLDHPKQKMTADPFRSPYDLSSISNQCDMTHALKDGLNYGTIMKKSGINALVVCCSLWYAYS